MWKTIEPDIWKPEEEEMSVEGTLVSKEPKTDDLSARYTIETENGAHFLVWGSTLLDDRLRLVSIGEFVRITYKDEKDMDKGRKLKLYKVEVRSDAPTVDEEVVE